MAPSARGLVLALAVVSLAGGPVRLASRAPDAADAGRVDFTRQIRPLLSDRCFRCHGPDAVEAQGQASTRRPRGRVQGAERRLGRSSSRTIRRQSELVRRISSDDLEDMMPPPESHLSLTGRGEGAAPALGRRRRRVSAALVARARRQPSAPPARVQPLDGGPTPSMRSFARGWQDEGLAPAPRAPPDVLIRRLAFNLTGLPPTPAEIDAFLADRSPGCLRARRATATSPRRPTASAWRWTGSISRAMPTPTAIRTTSSATCRPIATG